MSSRVLRGLEVSGEVGRGIAGGGGGHALGAQVVDETGRHDEGGVVRTGRALTSICQ